MDAPAPAIDRTYYAPARLVTKNTFIDFECLEEEDGAQKFAHQRSMSESNLARLPAGQLFGLQGTLLQDDCEYDSRSFIDMSKMCGDLSAQSTFTPSTCVSFESWEDLEPDDEEPDDEGKKTFSLSCAVVDELSRDSPQDDRENGQLPRTHWKLASCPSTFPKVECFDEPQNHEELDAKTTIMLRNLPADFSQADLVEALMQSGYRGLFDFIYMPMNMRSQLGHFGYGFVNFTTGTVAAHVMKHMQHRDDDAADSQRWASLWSDCQGLSANIARYRNSALMHPSVPKDRRPALYDVGGNPVAFPKPTKKIQKPRVHLNTSKTPSSSPVSVSEAGDGSSDAGRSNGSQCGSK